MCQITRLTKDDTTWENFLYLIVAFFYFFHFDVRISSVETDFDQIDMLYTGL